MMAAKALRSAIRGLPPLACEGAYGISDLTFSHHSSLTSHGRVLAIDFFLLYLPKQRIRKSLMARVAHLHASVKRLQHVSLPIPSLIIFLKRAGKARFDESTPQRRSRDVGVWSHHRKAWKRESACSRKSTSHSRSQPQVRLPGRASSALPSRHLFPQKCR